MITTYQGLLNPIKKKVSGEQKQRKIDGFKLKDLKQDDSCHSSVMLSEKNSSIRNVVNSSYFNTELSSSTSMTFSQISARSSKILHNNSQKSMQKLPLSSRNNAKAFQSISTMKQSPKKHSFPKLSSERRELSLQNILKRHVDTDFIKTLITFMNKDWAQQEAILFKEKRFQALRNVITQKTNLINHLVEEFISVEYEKYEEGEKKMMMSLLFKQNNKVLKEYESLFADILKKIPEDKIVKQESQLEEICSKLLDMFDPKFINSMEKMKERSELFVEGYTSQKNNLLASIVTKLKSNIDFISEVERYLTIYQKQVMKLKNQLQAMEIEKNNISCLLKKKANFTPIEMDYQRLKQIKDDSKKQFFEDLEANFVKFHEQQHKKNDKVIKRQERQNEELKQELELCKQRITMYEEKLETIRNSIPKKTSAETQVYLVQKKKANQHMASSSSILSNFLENVSSPFTFTEKITASLINLLSIDKILYDYQIIKHKFKLQSFSDFMLEWFLIRTGCKKVAQIFTKNFMFSVKELKGQHKRFDLFAKICGFNGFKKKNIQQDLEYIFFQTHRAWYYLVKIAMIYRKKLNENPTGYHLFPPLQCEGIFKLPLRKIYELIEQFLTSENIEIPNDLHNKIDYYAINQISKFKSHDEQFQKQQLQQIHILREINFDIIAGFIIEYIAKEKCTVVEKMLRTMSIKQKEMGDVLGYSEFEGLYRKFYKERRAKIEHIYSKICVTNQHDMLDIENAEPIIRAIIEDEAGLRGIFEQIQSLKLLILTEKANVMKNEVRTMNVNSYENFRDRFYYEFYDFYNTTLFLQEIYRIVKGLIRKKLKSYVKDEAELDSLIAEKTTEVFQNEAKQNNVTESDDVDQYSNAEEEEELKAEDKQATSPSKRKSQLEGKVEEWGKIVVRIPHFCQKVLTIDQIIVHNMRRKQMIDASQFAWRTLRDLLIMISKQ